MYTVFSLLFDLSHSCSRHLVRISAAVSFHLFYLVRLIFSFLLFLIPQSSHTKRTVHNKKKNSGQDSRQRDVFFALCRRKRKNGTPDLMRRRCKRGEEGQERLVFPVYIINILFWKGTD